MTINAQQPQRQPRMEYKFNTLDEEELRKDALNRWFAADGWEIVAIAPRVRGVTAEPSYLVIGRKEAR